eukprot:IDg514t1
MLFGPALLDHLPRLVDERTGRGRPFQSCSTARIGGDFRLGEFSLRIVKG